MEVHAHHEQGTDMTASLVKAGHHTDAVGPIAQDFLKPIVMPTAGPEAPDDPSSGSGLTQDPAQASHKTRVQLWRPASPSRVFISVRGWSWLLSSRPFYYPPWRS